MSFTTRPIFAAVMARKLDIAEDLVETPTWIQTRYGALLIDTSHVYTLYTFKPTQAITGFTAFMPASGRDFCGRTRHR